MEKPNIEDYKYSNGDIKDLTEYTEQLEKYVEYLETKDENLTISDDRISFHNVAEEMYQAINYTLNYEYEKPREKDDYRVTFMYPANNLSYKKLLKARNKYTEKLKQ